MGDHSLALCTVCKTTMKAHLSSIVSHGTGKKHMDMAKALAPTMPIAELLKQKLPDPQHVSELKLAVHIAGILLL